MNKKNGVKNKFISLFACVVIIIMIYDCNSIFTAGTHSNILNRLTSYIMILSVLILITLSYNSTIEISQYIINVSIITIYLIIYILIQRNQGAFQFGFTYLIRFILMFSLAYFVCQNHEITLFINIYINLITLIAIISLFFWLFGSVLNFVHPNQSYLSIWTGNYESVPSYFNVYFETQKLDSTIRNSAIFTEAPMASLSFSIALILEVLYSKIKNFHLCRVIILVLAVLSTLSSTGYIFLILLMGYIMLIRKNGNYMNAIKLVLVPVIMFILILLVRSVLNRKLVTSSGFERSKDFVNSFKAWVKYPIIGLGINTGQSSKDVANWDIGSFGYSTSFGKILGENGIYILILYLISAVKSFYIGIQQKDTNRIFITIMMIYLFVLTLFANTYLIFFIFSVMYIYQFKTNVYSDYKTY